MRDIYGTATLKRGEEIIETQSDTCQNIKAVLDAVCVEPPAIGQVGLACDGDTCCEGGTCKRKGKVELTLDQPSPVLPCLPDQEIRSYVASGLDPNSSASVGGTAKLSGNISPPPDSCQLTVSIFSIKDQQTIASHTCAGTAAASCSVSVSVPPDKHTSLEYGFVREAKASSCCLEENEDFLHGNFLEVSPPEINSIEGNTEIYPFPRKGQFVCEEVSKIQEINGRTAMPVDWPESRKVEVRYHPIECDLGKPKIEVVIEPKNKVDYWSHVPGSAPSDYIVELDPVKENDSYYWKLKQIWWYGSDENKTKCSGTAEYKVNLTLSFGSISAKTDKGLANISPLSPSGVVSPTFTIDLDQIAWQTRPLPIYPGKPDEASCSVTATLSPKDLFVDIALRVCGPGPYGRSTKEHEFFHYKQFTQQVGPQEGGFDYSALLSRLQDKQYSAYKTVTRKNGEDDKALLERACLVAKNAVLGNISRDFSDLDLLLSSPASGSDSNASSNTHYYHCSEEKPACDATCTEAQGRCTWECYQQCAAQAGYECR